MLLFRKGAAVQTYGLLLPDFAVSAKSFID